MRFSLYKHRDTPPNGGARLIQLETSRQSIGDTLEAIRREQADHAEVIAAFHRVFYASQQTHGMTFYQGVPILKSPLDLWVYQEIIWDLQPTLIIETGTAYGGSALYLAHQLDRSSASGQIISIDLEPAEKLPKHPRIHYIAGYSSTHPSVVEAVRKTADAHPRVMVILDSDHSKRHVLNELDAYASLVTNGQFLVVEDTNINGRPVPVDWRGGPGPGIAVDEWLPQHTEFEQATMAERYLMTFHTWMRRIQ